MKLHQQYFTIIIHILSICPLNAMQWDIQYEHNVLEKTDYTIAQDNIQHFKTLKDAYEGGTRIDTKSMRSIIHLGTIADNVRSLSGLSVSASDLRCVLYLLSQPQLYRQSDETWFKTRNIPIPRFKSPIPLNDVQCATLMEVAFECLDCQANTPVCGNICTIASSNIPYIDALLNSCAQETQAHDAIRKKCDTIDPFSQLLCLYDYANETVQKRILDAVYNTMLYSSPAWKQVDFAKSDTVCAWCKTCAYKTFEYIYREKQNFSCLSFEQGNSLTRNSLTPPPLDPATQEDRAKIRSLHTIWMDFNQHRTYWDFSNTSITYTHLPQLVKLRLIRPRQSRLFFGNNNNITTLHRTDFLALQKNKDPNISKIDFDQCNIESIPTTHLDLLPPGITFDITKNPINESFFNKNLAKKQKDKYTEIHIPTNPFLLVKKVTPIFFKSLALDIVSGLVTYGLYKGSCLIKASTVGTLYSQNSPLYTRLGLAMLPAFMSTMSFVGCLWTLVGSLVDIGSVGSIVADAQSGTCIKVDRAIEQNQ